MVLNIIQPLVMPRMLGPWLSAGGGDHHARAIIIMAVVISYHAALVMQRMLR